MGIWSTVYAYRTHPDSIIGRSPHVHKSGSCACHALAAWVHIRIHTGNGYGVLNHVIVLHAMAPAHNECQSYILYKLLQFREVGMTRPFRFPRQIGFSLLY